MENKYWGEVEKVTNVTARYDILLCLAIRNWRAGSGSWRGSWVE